MIFETHQIYHIYNQGNNSQQIFFSRENYLYFLKKIKQNILPHADILAWCLMPNHFHLMIYVHTLEISATHGVFSDSLTSSETITRTNNRLFNKIRNLNDSIGLMLRSYTQTINKQNNRTGSLFKPHTKSECITKSNGITPSFYNTLHGTEMWIANPEKEYPQACFNYIHTNPVKAKLVSKPQDWEFSSYCDYIGLRSGKLINKIRTEKFGIQLSLLK